jgi:hypothetical protein
VGLAFTAAFRCEQHVREVYSSESEVLSPIRCASPAAGVLPGTCDGMHGPQCADEHSRTRLLPRDEKPVRPDGDAGVAWLLPQDPAERSRQCAGYKDGDIPPGCSLYCLVGCFRAGESDLRCQWMG